MPTRRAFRYRQWPVRADPLDRHSDEIMATAIAGHPKMKTAMIGSEAGG
jgi:hypothetical protein